MAYRFGERVFAHICGHVLDCEVGRGSFGGQPTLVADAALRGRSGAVIATEFRLRLLSPALRPITAVGELADRLPLPQMTWAGQCSTFQVQHFEPWNGGPVALEICLFGETAIVGAFAEDGEPLRRAEQDDDGGDGDGTRHGDESEAEDEDDDDDDEEEEEEGDQVKCCVETFRHPSGALDTIAKPLVMKGFEGVGPIVYDVVCENFNVHASFSNRKGCLCACCEYRQEIKGKMNMTRGGKALNGGPVTDYVLAAAAPAGLLVPVQTLNPDTFVEDTVGNPDTPGTPWAYGHRDRPNGVFDEKGQPHGVPDSYTDACHYVCNDAPQMGMLVKGDSVDVDLTFRGRIIDVCNGDAVKESAEWTWTFKRTF